jgi:hypothetical protein
MCGSDGKGVRKRRPHVRRREPYTPN